VFSGPDHDLFLSIPFYTRSSTDSYRAVSIATSQGRAIAEAVIRWLPTAAARVRDRVWQVEFVVDKVASEQAFYEYFGFPCQNRIFHQVLHPHNHPGQVK
jgi:hypothetical protein